MLVLSLTSNAQRRSLRGVTIGILLGCVLVLLYHHCCYAFSKSASTRPELLTDDTSTKPELLADDTTHENVVDRPEVSMVIVSQTSDNMTWLDDTFPYWSKNIYVSDDPAAPLTVPANKGREAMAYLTYIVDHYDVLSPITIFHHAQRYQWHNDDPLYDGIRVLSRLRLAHVYEESYVNLRCVWTLGCPSEIHPLIDSEQAISGPDGQPSDARAGWYFKAAFEALFPDSPIPEAVGAPCCAQFAVTADRIRQRPKADYERYRRWLLGTELRDDLSGRIIEYAWHIIFGKDAVHCPNAKDCYCRLFGICDLECQSEGTCASQYVLPKFSVLPVGWPEYGWEGERQNVTEMLNAVPELKD